MPAPFAKSDRINLAPVLTDDLEAGAAPLGSAANDAVTGDRLADTEAKTRPTFREHVKAHPILAMALGGLAIGAIAAIAGRGTIARTAKPLLAGAIRPALIRAAARRPLSTAKLAARYPRAAARIAAGLRRMG
ncbi:hypothetical protein [Phenylobacterium sp.]|uniref:hypothetical protein n=1 Tax=Phenylobacterium sp. TaxID=1871053 RepID=UPI0030F40759